MNLLITNVTIVTNDEQDRVILAGAAVIHDTRIVAVSPAAAIRDRYSAQDGYQVIDGGGRILMPGFVNVHMHFYGTYARGLALPVQPQNFHEILQLLWWALDKVLDSEAVYYSALLPAVLGVRHGVTAFIDHHASPYALEGSLDRIEEALAQVGVRGLLCYEVSDRD